MRYLITIITIILFTSITGSVSAQSVDLPVIDNSKIQLQKVKNTREAIQNNIFKILETRSGTDISGNEDIHSDIDARMEIDQRYFQNRFKILSIDAPILYKLYT